MSARQPVEHSVLNPKRARQPTCGTLPAHGCGACLDIFGKRLQAARPTATALSPPLLQLVQYHIMTQPVRVALDANWPLPTAKFNEVPTASGTKMKARGWRLLVARSKTAGRRAALLVALAPRKRPGNMLLPALLWPPLWFAAAAPICYCWCRAGRRVLNPGSDCLACTPFPCSCASTTCSPAGRRTARAATRSCGTAAPTLPAAPACCM